MDRAARFRQITCTEHIRRDLAGRSVRAALFTSTAGFADFAIRLGSTAILARLIVPEHFGLVMMASAVIAIADQLRELGLSSATVQQPEITHAQVSNLFWINVAVGAGLALVTFAAAPFIASYYRDPRLFSITVILATTLLAGGLTVQHQALLTRQLKLGHTAAIRLASSLFSTALAIALAWWDFGYWALLWREVARAALLAAGMWVCFPWLPGLPSRRTDVRSLLRFGANLTGANILSSIASGFDRFLLGRFSGAGPVGVYRQAFQLIAAPTDQLLSPLYQVAQPSLSLLQNDAPRYRRLYLKLLTLVCLLTMPLSLFVAVYATELTLAFLGPTWLEAAPLLCLFSFGTFIKQAAGSAAFILITRGQGAIYLRLTVLHNVVSVVALCIGVRWGAIGAALAEVIVTYLMLAPRLRYCLAASPVDLRSYLTILARPALATLAMAWALLATHHQSAHLTTAAALTLGAVVAFLVFAATWLLLPGGRSELLSLISDLRNALRRKAARSTALAPAPAS
ncbi:MAG: lipopolysaccharide biosynthesis protein [Verrucomicrobiota bacterium]